MFKGLRTKIESEQNSQGGTSLTSNASSYPTKAASTLIVNQDRELFGEHDAKVSSAHTKSGAQSTSQTRDSSLIDSIDNKEKEPVGQPKPDLDSSTEKLMKVISTLNDKINLVSRERDDSNDQNAQLYILIEKLRRNLESEKETNASLVSKVVELEQNLKEAQAASSSSEVKLDGITHKSLSLNHSTVLTLDSLLPDDVGILKSRVADLQNQLSEKNRQMRIKQQNLNDIKKALQKEIVEHNSVKEELKKAQDQLKLHAKLQETVKFRASQNGSYACDVEVFGDKHEVESPPITPDGSGADIAASSLVDTVTPQLDCMSCASRSSTSVDELDPRDVHQSTGNTKEINHEYLKNVLFRYMTSGDAETSHHLVKALTVIMNFSPEQSAAIKRTLHAKTSWLRLK